MSRVFVSHSSKDNRQAEALRAWLIAQDPPLANEIFLDTDASTGLKTGMKWKNELIRANSRCEAVICLLSHSWESSPECLTEIPFQRTSLSPWDKDRTNVLRRPVCRDRGPKACDQRCL
ncbi:MAG: toll/interleukin-1 receptor domain-containing protein [Mycobacterium sp.]|nr:toll/interleukin-1 receptor domain-containing protein [Mycobacterium sp.]